MMCNSGKSRFRFNCGLELNSFLVFDSILILIPRTLKIPRIPVLIPIPELELHITGGNNIFSTSPQNYAKQGIPFLHPASPVKVLELVLSMWLSVYLLCSTLTVGQCEVDLYHGKSIFRALEDQIWILNPSHFPWIQIWILNPSFL